MVNLAGSDPVMVTWLDSTEVGCDFFTSSNFHGKLNAAYLREISLFDVSEIAKNIFLGKQ